MGLDVYLKHSSNRAAELAKQEPGAGLGRRTRQQSSKKKGFAKSNNSPPMAGFFYACVTRNRSRHDAAASSSFVSCTITAYDDLRSS